MMKHNFVINLALGSVLVVPAVTLQSGTSKTLAEALEQTIDALEDIAGIEQRVEDGTPAAVAEIVRFTERPLEDAEDPGAPDRILETLRQEVALLQIQVDEARREDNLAPMSAMDELVLDDHPVDLPVGTTGLDDRMRSFLAAPVRKPRRQTPRVAPPPTAADPGALMAGTEPTSIEAEGYTADALRLGRALYQKGRYQEGLDILVQLPGDQEARYWQARCLEKLGRFGEALDEFGKVASSEVGGHFVDRAREDIDFLRWRMSFQGQDQEPK